MLRLIASGEIADLYRNGKHLYQWYPADKHLFLIMDEEIENTCTLEELTEYLRRISVYSKVQE